MNLSANRPRNEITNYRSARFRVFTSRNDNTISIKYSTLGCLPSAVYRFRVIRGSRLQVPFSVLDNTLSSVIANLAQESLRRPIAASVFLKIQVQSRESYSNFETGNKNKARKRASFCDGSVSIPLGRISVWKVYFVRRLVCPLQGSAFVTWTRSLSCHPKNICSATESARKTFFFKSRIDGTVERLMRSGRKKKHTNHFVNRRKLISLTKGPFSCSLEKESQKCLLN